MCSYFAESAGGILCNVAAGSGAFPALSCEQAASIRTDSKAAAKSGRIDLKGLQYLATIGASCFAAQTSATIHPITLHPRNRLSRKIASVSRLLRANAMIDGRKYNTVPMPKNGKKMNVDISIGYLP